MLAAGGGMSQWPLVPGCLSIHNCQWHAGTAWQCMPRKQLNDGVREGSTLYKLQVNTGIAIGIIIDINDIMNYYTAV